jgi:hypothetical protein
MPTSTTADGYPLQVTYVEPGHEVRAVGAYVPGIGLMDFSTGKLVGALRAGSMTIELIASGDDHIEDLR